jgi:hypothetical protein
MTECAVIPAQFLQIPAPGFLQCAAHPERLAQPVGCKQVWLASYYEMMILNLHQELDRYLQA